eukprot:CAMPEP_0206194386 /NCGR_PEP_ID=MMETSP0166-20121206/7161_1 /ASSEMBLY_ACC=CAM_ASM_000260 /TAXON_ID=95228 /ORGANISM="Vannella robusta, Strain DIVA3 518/3/11/1/6" /LENGTH=52 /DNA_ID=CAMNT_0053611339 /DNA_START=96 /DNA_END=254 /DNA_ORIENTATION=-
MMDSCYLVKEKGHYHQEKFTGEGKTKTTGGKADESDEYVITNTLEAATTFPG